MSVFKGRGVILSESPVRESDKNITMLIKGRGRLKASAKGARKTGKLMAGVQLFTYGDFVFYDGGRFNTVTQADVIDDFYGIRDDYGAFCHAAYFAELCARFILEDEPCDELLLLLVKTLSVLAHSGAKDGLVRAAFELKFLQLNGFSPENELEGGERQLSRGAARAVEYILTSQIKDTYSFAVSSGVLRELLEISDVFINMHVGLELKSRKLL